MGRGAWIQFLAPARRSTNAKLQQLLAAQAEAEIKMTSITGKIESMVKRAREVAKPPWALVTESARALSYYSNYQVL